MGKKNNQFKTPNPPTPPEWPWGLVLFLAVVLAYIPVCWAGFIWDDDAHLTANPCIVGPLGFKEIWTTSQADISPLTRSTFWLEHALWGLAPLPYHLVNVFLHGACALVLWRVLRSLQIPGAWLGAALWALHPVEVESVAWITEMKNTESGLFFLLSTLFFLKWLKTRDHWTYALTLLLAAAAMACKSSTVILPGVLCLCAWWIEGRWHWRNLARVAPIFLISIAAAASTLWQVNHQLANTPLARSWPERLATAGHAVWFYLGKLIWPYPLITIYPRWQIDTSQWISYLPLATAIAILALLWINRETWARPWFFAFAYFLIALLPVLGLVDHYFLRYSFVADHFQYLASIAPLALIGAGISRSFEVLSPRQPLLRQILGSAVLLILGTLSWQRARAYQSEETLWTDTLAKNPDCWLGENNLGKALYQKGQVDMAMTHYQKSLDLNQTYEFAHNNLGLALFQIGQLDEAIAHFEKATKLDPDYSEAYNNLAASYAQKGRLDDAIASSQRALKINPYFSEAYNILSEALLKKGQTDDAISQCQTALKVNPDNTVAHNNLAQAYFREGRTDAAVDQFQESLRLNPNDAATHYNLGIVLLKKGETAHAAMEFQESLRLNPDDQNSQKLLAAAQAQLQSGK